MHTFNIIIIIIYFFNMFTTNDLAKAGKRITKEAAIGKE